MSINSKRGEWTFSSDWLKAKFPLTPVMTTAFVLQGPRQMGVISATAHYQCVLEMRESPHFLIQRLTAVGPHPMTYSDIKGFLSNLSNILT